MKTNNATTLALSCLVFLCLLMPGLGWAGPQAYISNYRDNTVSVIDTATDAVIDQFRSLPNGGPWGVAVRPNGQEVYFSQPQFPPAGGDAVAVIGTSAGHPKRDVAVGRGALGIAFDPSGKKVYQVNADDGSITVIEVGDKSTTTLEAGLNYPFGIAAASVEGGVRLYVTENGGGTVAVVDPAQGTVLARITVGRSPTGIAVNPSGTRVYVANYQDHTLSMIGTATGEVIRTTAVGYNPFGVAVNPSGSRVYVANQTKSTGSHAAKGTVSVINARTNTEIARVRVGRNPSGIAVTPDGSKVYVANTGGNTVSVIAAKQPKPKVVKTIKVGAGPVAFGAFIFAPTPSPGVQFLPPLVTGGQVIPKAISSDGSTVVGQATDAEGRWRAFRWTAETGTVALEDRIPGSSDETLALSVSGDGSIIVGNSISAQVSSSWIWTLNDGMQEIAMPEAADWSEVSHITANGAWAIGRYKSTTSGLLRVYIWSPSGGAKMLPSVGADPGEVSQFYPAAITPDGFTVFLTSVDIDPETEMSGSWIFRYGRPYGQGSVDSYFMQSVPSACANCKFYIARGAISRDGAAVSGILTNENGFSSPAAWFTGNVLLQLAPPMWTEGKCVSPGGKLFGGGTMNNGNAYLWSRAMGYISLMTYLQQYDYRHGTRLAYAFSGNVGPPASVEGIAASETRMTGLVSATDGTGWKAFLLDVP